jgi:hypothetical protein
MRYVETNFGRPSRSAMQRCEVDCALHCSCCGRESVRLALLGGRLVVASPLRRFAIGERELGDVDLRALMEGPLDVLHERIVSAGYDGLDFYCPDCDEVFCEVHMRCVPFFDQGFYDFTLGRCPAGHERIVDD